MTHMDSRSNGPHVVVETPDFLRDVKGAGIGDDERRGMIGFFAANPLSGVEIEGTGGARKTRFAGRGKGKSGGYRVISYYAGKDVPLFLLNVFAKGDKIDLTKTERNALRDVLSQIADAYRKGVRSHVEGR